jgi:hypothetical protein
LHWFEVVSARIDHSASASKLSHPFGLEIQQTAKKQLKLMHNPTTLQKTSVFGG